MSIEDCSYSETRNNRMKKSIEKITYCFVIIAALFVSFVSFVEPLVMKDINITKVILVLLCYAAVFAGSLTLFRQLSERVLYYLIIAGIFAAVIVQIYIVFHMRLVPKVDLNHIYDYCVDMVETGKISFGESKYFAYNTNNIPLAIVIYYVFRMAAFTGMDYRIAAGLFNVLLILVMYVSAFLILKKVTTIRTTAVYMALLLTNPSFYAYASYYYTDTISAGLVMAAVCFIIYGCYKKKNHWKMIHFLAAGFLIGFATCIRVTSIFIVLAVGVWILLNKYWKKLLTLGIPLVCGLLIFQLAWGGVYRYHVDMDTYDSAITIEHFLMMGSHGNGTYSVKDMRFTRSFPTHEEKVENNKKVYLEHLRENGVLGNLKLAIKKEAIVWGIGTHGYTQYTKNVVEKTTCYDWLVGKKSGLFRTYMQAYNIVLYVLILSGVCCTFRKKKTDKYSWILAIYWCGALVFYIFWEAHPRQSVSILPLLTMLAVPWIERSCIVRD